jgi:hypothetical protein
MERIVSRGEKQRVKNACAKMGERLMGEVDGECWIEKRGDNECADENDTGLVRCTMTICQINIYPPLYD